MSNSYQLMGSLLSDAKEVVGQRGDSYGTPIDDFKRIAALWDVLRPDGSKYEPHDVAMYMICLKLSRLTHSPLNRDSWLDIAGYAACGYACAVQEDYERQSPIPDSASYEDRLAMATREAPEVRGEVPTRKANHKASANVPHR